MPMLKWLVIWAITGMAIAVRMSYRHFYMEEYCPHGRGARTINMECHGPSSAGLLSVSRRHSYGPGMNCTVKLEAPQRCRVLVSLAEVNTRVDSSRACIDYLQIEPVNARHNSVIRECGTASFAEELRSFSSPPHTSSLILKFVSNNDGSTHGYTGFSLSFTAFHDEGFGCNQDEFQCANSRCVWIGLQCDGHNNCGDGSDESVDSEPGCGDKPLSPYVIWTIVGLTVTGFLLVAIIVCGFVRYKLAHATLDDTQPLYVPASSEEAAAEAELVWSTDTTTPDACNCPHTVKCLHQEYVRAGLINATADGPWTGSPTLARHGDHSCRGVACTTLPPNTPFAAASASTFAVAEQTRKSNRQSPEGNNSEPCSFCKKCSSHIAEPLVQKPLATLPVHAAMSAIVQFPSDISTCDNNDQMSKALCSTESRQTCNLTSPNSNIQVQHWPFEQKEIMSERDACRTIPLKPSESCHCSHAVECIYHNHSRKIPFQMIKRRERHNPSLPSAIHHHKAFIRTSSAPTFSALDDIGWNSGHFPESKPSGLCSGCEVSGRQATGSSVHKPMALPCQGAVYSRVQCSSKVPAPTGIKHLSKGLGHPANSNQAFKTAATESGVWKLPIKVTESCHFTNVTNCKQDDQAQIKLCAARIKGRDPSDPRNIGISGIGCRTHAFVRTSSAPSFSVPDGIRRDLLQPHSFSGAPSNGTTQPYVWKTPSHLPRQGAILAEVHWPSRASAPSSEELVAQVSTPITSNQTSEATFCSNNRRTSEVSDSTSGDQLSVDLPPSSSKQSLENTTPTANSQVVKVELVAPTKESWTVKQNGQDIGPLGEQPNHHQDMTCNLPSVPSTCEFPLGVQEPEHHLIQEATVPKSELKIQQVDETENSKNVQ